MLIPAIRNARFELRSLQSRSHDFDFLGMIWASDAVRSGYAEQAAPFMTFPPEVAGAGIDHPLAVRPWEMETLATQLILTPKTAPGPGVLRVRCQSYTTMLTTALMLREIEGEEQRHLQGAEELMMEMHRFGHHQFPWQNGLGNRHRIYKYLYLYAQGRCADHLQNLYKVPIDHFINLVFWLYTLLAERPWAPIVPVDGLGATHEDFHNTMTVLSKDITELHDFTYRLVNDARREGVRERIAYKPSFLRRFPIITDRQDGGLMIAPLPQLIIYRATAGLYYDIVGNTPLTNEANKRFEDYTIALIRGYCPQFDPIPEVEFGPRRHRQRTPDVLVRHNGEVAMVIECKAARLSFDAQFADDPFADAEGGYKQIAKGIAQVWRFFGAVRTGLYDLNPVAADAIGIVHTLDPWLQMSHVLYMQCVEAASVIVREEGWDVVEADMKTVVVVSSNDLEDSLSSSDEPTMLNALRSLQEREHWGWQLYDVRRKLGNMPADPKDFPFDMGDVMPWWRQHFEEMARQGQKLDEINPSDVPVHDDRPGRGVA